MVEVRAWGVAPEFAQDETNLAEFLVTIVIEDNGNGTFGAGDLITVDGAQRVIQHVWRDTFIVDGVGVEVAAIYVGGRESFSIPYVEGQLVPAYPAVSTGIEFGWGFPETPFPTTNILCFARGTLIRCANQDIPIQNLKIGDLVETKDHGEQPVRWIGSTALDAEALKQRPNLRPIRIAAGSLGRHSPAVDLVVSPQHRVLVRSKIAQKMFSSDEVLVAAKQLLQVDGIQVADDLDEVEYFHILFDQHEIIRSNGAETESLFTGPEAMKAVGPAALREILDLFPHLAQEDYQAIAARTLASGRSGRRMAQRHAQNRKVLVQ